MNYTRTSLRATAVSVREDWIKTLKAQAEDAKAKHRKAFAKWESERKPAALAALADATKRIKAGQPVPDTYALRDSLANIPTAPADADCCNQTTKTLDALIELLDDIADELVSSSALAQAGFKDLSYLLRRPC